MELLFFRRGVFFRNLNLIGFDSCTLWKYTFDIWMNWNDMVLYDYSGAFSMHYVKFKKNKPVYLIKMDID